MNEPDQEQIEYWLEVAKEGIDEKLDSLNSGFYEKENIPIQSHYLGLAMEYASLARARFLNRDPIDEVREQLANAAKNMMKSFIMAYDKTDPDYQGGSTDWSCVSETRAIAGMNYALISGDFNLSKEMASWFQDRHDGFKMDIEVNRYAHALAETLKGNVEGARSILLLQLEEYKKKPAKKGFRLNYFTLSTTLSGISERDEKKFNDGLLAQLEFYQSYARGEAEGTTDEFICDNAVALANLGIFSGLNVTVVYDTLPKGLLLSAS